MGAKYQEITKKWTCVDMEDPRSKDSYSTVGMSSLFHILYWGRKLPKKKSYCLISLICLIEFPLCGIRYSILSQEMLHEVKIEFQKGKTKIFMSIQTLSSVLSWSSQLRAVSASVSDAAGSLNLWASSVDQPFSVPLLFFKMRLWMFWPCKVHLNRPLFTFFMLCLELLRICR